MEINAQLVKQLREHTEAGMMDCKHALAEMGGDMERAIGHLRTRGVAAASKKAIRVTHQGVIATYIHPGSQVGALIEVNCESDFVARTGEFLELVRDLAMQVAATSPEFVRKEDVSAGVIAAKRENQRVRAMQEGKPERMIGKIVEGRMNRFFEEACLYEQPFIKENTITVGDLIKTTIAKLGENISVSRFSRMKVGEGADHADGETEGANHE